MFLGEDECYPYYCACVSVYISYGVILLMPVVTVPIKPVLFFTLLFCVPVENSFTQIQTSTKPCSRESEISVSIY